MSEVTRTIVNECRARSAGDVSKLLKDMSTRDIAEKLGMRFDGTIVTDDHPAGPGRLRIHYGIAMMWKPSLGLTSHGAYTPARGLRNGVQWADVPIAGKHVRLFDGHIHTTSPSYQEANLIKTLAPDPTRVKVMLATSDQDFSASSAWEICCELNRLKPSVSSGMVAGPLERYA